MENNSYDGYIRRKMKKQRTGTVLLCALLVIIFSAITFVAAYFIFFRPSVSPTPPFINNGTTGTDEAGQVIVDTSGPYARKSGYYTFLIAGLDDASLNTDVMMLASLDTENHRINILQIPRDTFVNKYVGGYSYVNSVNAMYSSAYHSYKVPAQGSVSDEAHKSIAKTARLEAMRDVCSRLEKSLCVKIDRFILLDTAAFREIIDSVGGVEFDVPFDMDYDDPAQNLHIHLKAGKQILDGAKAEQFIRFRKGEKYSYPAGDIDRVDARADFMRAALSQVKSNVGFSLISQIIKTVSNDLDTDIKIEEAIYFAKEAYKVPDGNITIKTIGGTVLQNPVTGVWKYYCLNRDAAIFDINKYMNAFTRQIDAEIFDTAGFFTNASDAEYSYINVYYNS